MSRLTASLYSSPRIDESEESIDKANEEDPSHVYGDIEAMNENKGHHSQGEC